MRIIGLGLFLCLGLTMGCSSDGDITGINITLAPNPKLNTYKQIAENVTTIRFVFDSPEGLYPGGEDRTEGDLELKDIDDDGAVELLTDLPLRGDRLPTVRLEKGALSDQTITVEIEGLDDKENPLAYGVLDSLQFIAGTLQDVEPASFNLLVNHRPPRVVTVIPDDVGEKRPTAELLISFEKHMDFKSLRDPPAIQVIRVDGGKDTPIACQKIALEVPSSSPNISVAHCTFSEPLAAGNYRVEVSSNAKDLQGRSLDQVPMKDGNQGWISHFEISDKFEVQTATSCPGGTCPDPLPPCGDAEACSADFDCVDGLCLPLKCPVCPEATVCDPKVNLCVADCRVYGRYGCSDPTPTCDKNGLCSL